MSCLSPDNKLLEHCVLNQHKEQALDNYTILLFSGGQGDLDLSLNARSGRGGRQVSF